MCAREAKLAESTTHVVSETIVHRMRWPIRFNLLTIRPHIHPGSQQNRVWARPAMSYQRRVTPFDFSEHCRPAPGSDCSGA